MMRYDNHYLIWIIYVYLYDKMQASDETPPVSHTYIHARPAGAHVTYIYYTTVPLHRMNRAGDIVATVKPVLNSDCIYCILKIYVMPILNKQLI
jgi:hypothetical protein